MPVPMLQDSSGFAASLLAQYMENGWGSLGKRDLELLLFILLEKDGALAKTASNYELARLLRLTETRVAALRRDAYARWRPLLGEDPADTLRRVFQSCLAIDNLEKTMKFATERRMKEGFIPLLIEHPDDRAEVERAIKTVGSIPIHERNREVVLIHYDALLAIAEQHDLLEKDPRVIQREISNILGSQETLKGFLTTPIGKLTPAAARAAMNDAGAIVIEKSLKSVMPQLLKLLIPVIL